MSTENSIRKYEAFQKMLYLNSVIEQAQKRVHESIIVCRKKKYYNSNLHYDYKSRKEVLYLKKKFNKLRLKYNIPCIWHKDKNILIPILVLD